VELSGYLAILRRWWWTLLVAAWVAGLMGYVIAGRIEPTYESSARLLVGPINSDTNTLRASSQLVQTYAELATSQPLLEATVKQLGVDAANAPDAAVDLAAAVRTIANDQTRILSIRVEGSDPALTTRAANGIAAQLIETTSRGSTAQSEGQLTVIDFAKEPTIPVAPQVSLIVLMSVAAGLLGAIVLVLLVEYLADRIQDRDELARATGKRVIGEVTAGAPAATATKVSEASTLTPTYDYAPLVAGLTFGEAADGRRDLVVAMADEGPHGSDLAAGIAAAAAEWRLVVLVDADPNGRLSWLLGASGLPGLHDPLGYRERLTDRIVAGSIPNTRILPAGTNPGATNPSPEEARLLLESVAGPGDVVIIDVGTLPGSSTAMVWGGVVGSTVLAVRRGSTRRSVVRQAVALLDMVHGRLVGSVLILPGRRRRAKNPPGGDRPTAGLTPEGRLPDAPPEVETPAANRAAMARPRKSDQG
jgi:capsular polysaccharide biosynthesis protein